MHPVLRLISQNFLQSLPGAAGSGAADAAPPMVTSVAGSSAVVLDSPHSGTVYPADFGSCLPLATLRQAEDTHVEKIYAFAPGLGVSWVEAHFPRIYLDANRDTTEIDTTMIEGEWPLPVTTDQVVLQKVRLGKGLIWKFTDEGVPIYDRQLPAAELLQRIERCWKPYHAAVERAIDGAHARHGYSIHINCHSMPSVAASHATLHPGLVHADFVIGDRDGSTASPALSERICAFLRERGYSVDYNHPYKGVELVRRYGKPAEHRHSIQIEINRKLYMNEQTLDLDQAGYLRLTTDLKVLVEQLMATDPRTL